MRRGTMGTRAGLAALLLVLLLPAGALAGGVDSITPWEKFSVQGGVFFSGLNNQILVGPEGAGVQFDVESLLGLKAQRSVFRAAALYRIGEERRHRLDLDYLSFTRSATRTLDRDITVDNVALTVGDTVDSTFNFQVIRAGYSYSFFQDDRMDLAASIGFFVMPLKFELSASKLAPTEGKISFTAPLPALGLRGDFAITPRWILRNNLDFFYLEYQNFSGGLVDARIALDYNPWSHFGVGVGLDSFKLRLNATKSGDYPGVNFLGTIKSEFLGAQLYAKYFF